MTAEIVMVLTAGIQREHMKHQTISTSTDVFFVNMAMCLSSHRRKDGDIKLTREFMD